MDEIISAAAEHGAAVIEDAAHALPCKYKGRDIGTIGHMGVFSFYATKTITTGEGGMLVTNNGDFAERARIMSLHGMSRDAWRRYDQGGSWRYDVVAPGFKYNMTDIAAALGISQLRKADWLWERRAAIASRYSSAFSAYPQVQIPVASPQSEHSWHLYVLRLNAPLLRITRDVFLEMLAERGVSTSVHFIPLHTFTYYRSTYGYKDHQFPAACREFARMFSLPIFPSMSDADVDFVIEAVSDLVTKYRF
jgi:dTDP-4-amino-4,6-dideoxygalactose transaminase